MTAGDGQAAGALHSLIIENNIANAKATRMRFLFMETHQLDVSFTPKVFGDLA